MLFRNDKGFSLVSVMVAAGLLGGLSLAVMQLMKNMNQDQSFAQSKADEIELKTSIRFLLDDERHCRVSLAGNGASGTPTTPVVFNKEDIDEDNEGLDVALYLSNQAGDARGLKKFNGSNNPDGDDKSKYGKLTITSMKLIMNNGTGSNYSESTGHNDVGQLRVVAQKKISSSQTRDVVMNFDLNVGMTTDSSNESTILSCSRQREIDPEEQIHDLRHCVSLGIDGSNHGTALCWEKDGSNVVAIKTANGSNPDYGIGTNFRKASHNLSIIVAGCVSLGRDGSNHGTALCREKDGTNVVAIKTANGSNPDYGIGTNFRKASHNLGF